MAVKEEGNDLLLVQEKEKKIKELEDELQQAKEAYFLAIRQMHVGGKSLREIAQLLNLSHQRVHQIIESENKGWRFWLKRPLNPDLACSFCEVIASRVNKLVQGPNIFACDGCIITCRDVIRVDSPRCSIWYSGREFKKLDSASKLRCSFCGKLPNHKNTMVAAKKHQVCNKCVQLSLKYMQIDDDKSAKLPDLDAVEPNETKKAAVVILHIRIQRNSKFVRGIKKTIEEIESILLPRFRPRYLPDGRYELQVLYLDDADLDKQMNELISECHDFAEAHNCFSESDIRVKGEERYWD